MKLTRARLLVGASGVLSTLLGAPAFAQDAGANMGTEEIVVTAQRREQQLQDVPIAVSALSAEALDSQKIEGGPDLLRAIPNVAFTKTNFTSYNFSIRGIGTQAVSASTDPAVAVSFNDTPLIQNRLFEQEYFDVARVEVLRGPQGTLYGRNATAGVVNVISHPADLTEFSGMVRAEGGNFDSRRLVGMINLPIVNDVLAVRLAGALTRRDGYDFNSVTDNRVNGRDLWSGRLSVGFQPSDDIHANFIWEHFNEDDDRSRTGKQLCHRDPGPQFVGNTDLGPGDTVANLPGQLRPFYSQGCLPGSLYDDGAFGTPNGLSLPFVGAAIVIPPIFGGPSLLINRDPYGGETQSHDLREIASFRDPRYRAKADVYELNLNIDVSPSLTFSSETAYNTDQTYSFQDYNRFNTQPIFNDTSDPSSPAAYANLAPGGIFCDPQVGCSNTLAGFDIAQAQSTQFSQEFRLQSSFEGAFNFSLGANYTEFQTQIDYYVFNNLLSALALMPPFYTAPATGVDRSICTASGYLFGPAVAQGNPMANCPYLDPNPIDFNKNFHGDGHNYFRSDNPYELRSAAVFGEGYLNLPHDLRLTAGFRYTDDNKTSTPVPSQLLTAVGIVQGGYISAGYPARPDIRQHWGEWTGRLVLDWKPDLSFTDDTLLYASFSHGYKAGGTNPPTPGFATAQDLIDFGVLTPAEAQNFSFIIPLLTLPGVEYGPTFDPEFVNAFEIGAKNTLMGGALTLNLTAFLYDYTDYQVSQIRDRSAVNENFDTTNWGLEFETLFSPSRNFQITANVGYLSTRIAEGERSIDIMNRTQSDPNYVLVKPWLQLPSNCIVPTAIAEQFPGGGGGGWTDLCGGVANGQKLFDFADFPEINNGAGIFADLGGNQLPNAPHWTVNLGAQYTLPLIGEWTATVRGDAYWQSQSFARIYNDEPYDKLRGWYNLNLSLEILSPDKNSSIELYVKNVLDDTPITGAFLNSDDTGLTTNVFTLDPRIIGLRIARKW